MAGASLWYWNKHNVAYLLRMKGWFPLILLKVLCFEGAASDVPHQFGLMTAAAQLLGHSTSEELDSLVLVPIFGRPMSTFGRSVIRNCALHSIDLADIALRHD